MKPIRIQRKRTRGYDMQAESRAINGLECVYVGRPTLYGNPIKGEYAKELFEQMIRDIRDDYESHFLAFFHADKTPLRFNKFCASRNGTGVYRVDAIPKLRRKNLACWCPLDQPCHADVLLELAND
jgi:hypothetical protein